MKKFNTAKKTAVVELAGLQTLENKAAFLREESMQKIAKINQQPLRPLQPRRPARPYEYKPRNKKSQTAE